MRRPRTSPLHNCRNCDNCHRHDYICRLDKRWPDVSLRTDSPGVQVIQPIKRPRAHRAEAALLSLCEG
ncbi:hypothetical protein CEXT_650931 [Caerostris extrusa]|uniref:Zn(2)-C6 fungal-type domain-containing protein n=1 Tax=Caerostris extrusa TaxID=172846 RepID=A0AAV4V270_CAEEX|nr:hypothetical protein CEXT_650931 [Caerostris extrusa]